MSKEKLLGWLIGLGIGIPFVLLLCALAAPIAIWNGFALRTLWAWFIVPAFGLKPLSLLHATGVCLVVHYLAWQPDNAKSEAKSWQALLFITLIGPLIPLYIGWLVRWILG